MGKHFEEVIFFLIIGWFIWVVIGSNGSVRVERGCTPVQWGGEAITSVARAAGTDYGNEAALATNTVDYHCRMALWDFFYRSEWEKQHPGQPVPGSTSDQPAQTATDAKQPTDSGAPLTQPAPTTTIATVQ